MDTVILSFAFMFACIFIFLISISILAVFSHKQEHNETFEGEYSLHSIFVPYRKELGLKNLYLLIFSPYSWAVQGILVCIMALAYLSPIVASSNLHFLEGFAAFLASGMLAFTFSFMYCVIVWFFDLKEREPLRFVAALFLWGTTAGFISAILNTMVGINGEFFILVVVLFAPFIEEVLKGLGLVALQFHHEWDGKLDGMIYGFLIGMGFSFVENWSYFSQYGPAYETPEAWVSIIVMRTFTTGLVHGFFTATTGFIIGHLKRASKNPLLSIAAFIPAMILHATYNGISILISGFELVGCIGAFAVLGLVGFVIFYKNHLQE